MKWVAFSSVFAGIAGYVVILFATNAFGADHRFEVFNVFWGLFFTIQGVIQGLMHETTRAVRASRLGSSPETPAEEDDPTAPELLLDEPSRADRAVDEAGRARPMRVGGALGLIVAGLVLASSPLWAPVLLTPDERVLGVALLTAASCLSALQAAFYGALSGMQRWGAFAFAISGEAALRVIVAVGCVAFGAAIAGFLYATVAGAVMTPLMLIVSRRSREALGVRADVSTGAFIARTGQAMLAASAAAVLVVGFPVLIKTALHDTPSAVIANLLLAVTLTRAPILMPITSFQNAIVVYFVERTSKGRVVVLLPVAVVLGVAGIGAALAFLVGEPIIQFMGPGFAVGGPVLAALTFAAGFTGGLFITGSAVLAREHHAIYVAGWWTASITAVLLLVLVNLVDGAITATVLALSVGPAVGMLVHVVFGMRRPRSSAAAAFPETADRAGATEPVETA